MPSAAPITDSALESADSSVKSAPAGRTPAGKPDPFARARRMARRILFIVSALIVIAFSIFVVTVNYAAPPMVDPLPTQVREPYRAARAAMREHDYVRAGIYLQMVHETANDYPRAMRLLASLLTSRGQERHAVPYANEAVLVDPLNGESWIRLGKTYVRAFADVVRGGR